MGNVVITGATSMIGTATIKALVPDAAVDRVYALVRKDSAHLYRLPVHEKITTVCCDIQHLHKLHDLIREADVFYHFGWTGTDRRNEDIAGQARNIQYTLDALEAAHVLGCTKFIGAGSQAEYGTLNVDRIAPDSPCDPVQPYGIAKYAAGKLARARAAQLGMDCLWVRIFSVYGYYDHNTTMIQYAVRRMLAGEETEFTEATNRWDYLYSEDAGSAFALLGEKAHGNKVYCLGSGQARPLREYILDIQKVTGCRKAPGFGRKAAPPQGMLNLCADISELRGDIGWEPKTRFEDGVASIVNHMRADSRI